MLQSYKVLFKRPLYVPPSVLYIIRIESVDELTNLSKNGFLWHVLQLSYAHFSSAIAKICLLGDRLRMTSIQSISEIFLKFAKFLRS